MPEEFKFDINTRVRSGWNHAHMHVGKRLTDRKIKEYIEAGFYSEQFKGTRRERQKSIEAWRARHGV